MQLLQPLVDVTYYAHHSQGY